MMKNLLFLSSALLFSTISLAQNVGINGSGAAPANCAMLDIAATDKGLLIPRVALTNISTYAPLTGTAVTGLLVFSTSAPTGGNGTGYYYWTGSIWANLIDNITPGAPWYTSGNAGTTASSSAYGTAANNNFIGTTDNVSMAIVTNNLERGRFLGTGEIVFGALTTTIADDFFSAVSNATLDWAVNGYSAFDGSGVYGQVTGGTTIFGGVQGEYNGTASGGTGVRGIYTPAGNGTSFNLGAGRNGVDGSSTATGNYKFGVAGTGGVSTRSGGVIGNDGNFRWGACGYFSSGSVDYSLYGFGMAVNTGAAGGRLAAGNHLPSSVEPNNQVGIGIYGGVMGGWIKGLVYGTNFSGDKYGVYVHGNTVTNSKYVQLNSSENSDTRIASYATTALTNELTSKGKIQLVNGRATVSFDSKLTELCTLESLVITATAMGNCNGVYIDEITKSGFTIKEMNNGAHSVAVSFIISGTLKQASEFTETEILSKQYETNMDGVMHNDYDTATDGTPIWYDGQTVRHDNVDPSLTKSKEAMAKDAEKLLRQIPTEQKK